MDAVIAHRREHHRRRPVAGALLAFVVLGCGTQPDVPSPVPHATAAATAIATTSPTALRLPTPSPTQSALGSGAVVARYDDGLPSVIGDQLVLRGQAAIDFAASQIDDTPFLVGGWVDYEGGTRYCTIGPPPGHYSWRSDCQHATFADLAGSWSPAQNDAITFHYALEGLHTGPVVAVVRVHDPRAETCGAAVTSICDGMMVVQSVIWSGDLATAAGPLTPTDVRDALARLGVPGKMGDSCTLPPWNNCGVESLGSADVYPFMVGDAVDPAVTAISVEPTAAALQRALPGETGVDAALLKAAIVTHVGSKDGFGAPWIWVDLRWLVVDNVALLVRTHSPATAGDRRFLERLVAALDAAP
jgi:hypothetical protein